MLLRDCTSLSIAVLSGSTKELAVVVVDLGFLAAIKALNTSLTTGLNSKNSGEGSE